MNTIQCWELKEVAEALGPDPKRPSEIAEEIGEPCNIRVGRILRLLAKEGKAKQMGCNRWMMR